MGRSRNFYQGGGVQARQPENSLNNVFLLLFFSPQLILQFTEGVQWFYYRDNYTFPRIQGGSNIFQGEGVQLFPGGGVQMLISIEIHITCDFPGGGGVRTLYPPSGSTHVLYTIKCVVVNN